MSNGFLHRLIRNCTSKFQKFSFFASYFLTYFNLFLISSSHEPYQIKIPIHVTIIIVIITLATVQNQNCHTVYFHIPCSPEYNRSANKRILCDLGKTFGVKIDGLEAHSPIKMYLYMDLVFCPQLRAWGLGTKIGESFLIAEKQR